jgi:hypothetical protein
VGKWAGSYVFVRGLESELALLEEPEEWVVGEAPSGLLWRTVAMDSTQRQEETRRRG